jgi:hypothetical protein
VIELSAMSEHLHDNGELLAAFRNTYQQYEQAVRVALLNPTDPTVLARLGDDLDGFATLAIEVSRTNSQYLTRWLESCAERNCFRT